MFLSGVFVVGIIGFLGYNWKRRPDLAWLAICALSVYIPISNFPTVPSFVVAPYRCAEAGVAVACILGIFCHQVFASKNPAFSTLLAINFGASLFITAWGVQVWLKPANFFRTVVDNDSHFIMGVERLGRSLSEEGKNAESIATTQKTLAWVFSSDDWLTQLRTGKTQILSRSVGLKLRTNSGIPDFKELLTLMGQHAFALANIGDSENASICLSEYLKVAPSDPWAHLLYAKCIGSKDREVAMKHMAEALRLNPNYTEATLALAAQNIYGQRYRAAIELLQKLTTESRQNGIIGLMLCDAKIGLRDKKGALAALEMAAKATSKPSPAVIDSRARQINRLP